METGIIESFFIIFVGAAVLATFALYTRQPLIVAYIAVGCVLGPNALALVADPALLAEVGEIGIIFLLYLVGLDLPPNKLKDLFRKSVLTALGSSAAFFAVGFGVLYAFGFTLAEACIAGVAAMFSSTILGIKLLPTTVLHHRHIGELVISLLLIQDVIAILALLVLAALSTADSGSALGIAIQVAVALPAVAVVAAVGVRYLIVPVIARFDAFHEFIFLLAVGWCLGIASLGHLVGLSFEIGAIVAGVSLANSPIAQYITESLRPLRDFFLVLFFFSVGAAIDPVLLAQMAVPTVILAVVLVAIKPPVFRALLRWQGEPSGASTEAGFRLGQASEFSLLLTYVAGAALLSAEAAHVIQGATVVTLLVSTYLVIFRYPSPIAVSERLRRN